MDSASNVFYAVHFKRKLDITIHQSVRERFNVHSDSTAVYHVRSRLVWPVVTGKQPAKCLKIEIGL